MKALALRISILISSPLSFSSAVILGLSSVLLLSGSSEITRCNISSFSKYVIFGLSISLLYFVFFRIVQTVFTSFYPPIFTIGIDNDIIIRWWGPLAHPSIITRLKVFTLKFGHLSKISLCVKTTLTSPSVNSCTTPHSTSCVDLSSDH